MTLLTLPAILLSTAMFFARQCSLKAAAGAVTRLACPQKVWTNAKDVLFMF
jgi:hypothetical protein